MAKTLISSYSFIGTPLPSLPRHGFHSAPRRRLIPATLKFSFHEIPPIHFPDSSVDFNAIASRAEGLLYTLADAAVVAVDPASGDAAVQKNGGWFGFISDAMEVVLFDFL
ncbi:Inner membrane protein PPF-1, chloroplastic [Sarracenia purpurea var. burkii]